MLCETKVVHLYSIQKGIYDESFIFDIDGTLVSFETHRIPSSTIEALEAAHAKGLKIFIATGRPKAIINNLSELQDRNLIDGYITMNGAYCFVGEEVIYKSAIPQEEVKAMAAFCEKKGVPCIFVEEHNISVCQPNEMVKKIFYDFLHVNVIPTVSFEEASNKEVIQMTPLHHGGRRKRSASIHPDLRNRPLVSGFLRMSQPKAIPNRKASMKSSGTLASSWKKRCPSATEETISACSATQLSESLWGRPKRM